MSAAERIHDKLPSFCFGLWNHCPEDAPIAWGARGIADRGTGFGLLPDRQTMVGPEVLREPFSKLVLNKGSLEKANLTAKRLRSGWSPYKDLSREEFRYYYLDRFNEYKAEFKNPEDRLFDGMKHSWVHREERKLSREEFDRIVHEPDQLYRELQYETEAKERYWRICEERQDVPRTPPAPPKQCEECEIEFRKIRRSEYENCYFDDFDAWVCDECGAHHSFDWPDDEDNPDPGQPILHLFEPLIGPQHQKMFDDKLETFTLFDDHQLKILGNTNGSYGYVYLIAFPKHEVIDFSVLKPSSEHPGYDDEKDETLAKPDDIFWSGSNPPPMPGDEIEITCNGIGKALVFGHFVTHNYLHLNVLPLAPPDFYLDNVKRNGSSMLTNVVGSEIG